MRSSKGRTGVLETAVSFFLLAVILLIAAGIFFKQNRYEPERFSLDYRAAEAGCPHGMPIGELMAEAAKLLV